jgi:hypothetical protein
MKIVKLDIYGISPKFAEARKCGRGLVVSTGSLVIMWHHLMV